ncbi:MAG TPA: aminotransferase class V-fold PLP-dependent enzyme, partial [Pseudobdellovibrionaceae bacterium]|nr:aminotransferase class V-fold PLP-dependent enzyme [Pseudobdellovibrionaceae bacterium]
MNTSNLNPLDPLNLLDPSTLANYFQKIRQDFPALDQKIHGQNLIYLDSAATSLKPRQVIQRITSFYEHESANIHRGAHLLADQATEAFEQSRNTIAQHINAQSSDEIIFTKGTTESINLIATALGRGLLNSGDEILISEMEHHSNIVPWHLLSQDKGVIVKMIKVKENGELDYEDFQSQLSNKTKLVSVTACSNVLGTINNIQFIIEKAHEIGALVVIDGAQSIVHSKVDVQKLGCDFYVFSGHKVFAPFGIGILYGKKDLLNQLPPYQGGGSMIESVFPDKSTYLKSPFRFEAGTPPVSGAIALGTALKYLQNIGIEKIQAWENILLKKAMSLLTKIEGLHTYGNPSEKCGIISFN